MLVSELLASFSQILLKKSADTAHRSRIGEYLNRLVIPGYGLLFCSMLLTIRAYAYADSYMIVPVLETLGYIFVMLLGRIFFRERITGRKLAGMGLILAGILMFYL